MFLRSLIVCWNLFYLNAATFVKVDTPYGTVIGKHVVKLLTGNSAEVFLGIPYAQPPLGDLRFEKPEPIEPWNETLSALKYSLGCSTLFALESSEDCLTINIARPVTPSPDPKGYPVMLFIHGGAFYQGSSWEYHYSGPIDKILPHGVIFVSINYRLGPWGWLSTGTDEAPGNMGLWDQLEALKFHKKIISSFGGDPERITIFGESAGGVSVSWLTLMPQTDGLFAKAISMSGSSLAIWGHNEHVIESSEYVLNKLCPKFNGTEAVNCLKTKSQDEILNALRFKMPTIIRRDDPNIVDFGPRLGGAKDLIPNGDLQAAIKQAPKRPHLIGFNSLDMLTFAIPNPYIPPTLKAEIPIPKLSSLLLFDKTYFSTIVKKVFGKTSIFGETNATKISESIVDYYAKNVAANYTITGWIQAYLQCLSDIDFYVPAIREARYKAAAGWSNVYMYRYSYANPLIQLVLDPRIKGSPHAFDLFNFFDNVLGIPEPPPTLIDLKVRKNFVDLFIDFVKGNDMEISPVTENQAPYIDVNVRNSISPDFAPKTVQFWDDLGKEFGFDWPSGDIIN